MVKRIVAFVLLALLAWWVVRATEWVEVDVRKPPSGEAARNPLYAMEQLARVLGVRVQQQQGLDAMPPAGARLLLESPHWDLFPQRAERLRQWVENGGHLVLPASLLLQKQSPGWLPVRLAERDPLPPARLPPRGKAGPCRTLSDGAQASYEVCTGALARDVETQGTAAPLLRLQGPSGAEVLRMPLGRGSVTVLTPLDLLGNKDVLAHDHPVLAATVLQLERGAVLWVVTEEGRSFLLAWLWREAWIVVVLVLLAAAAWVWRSVVRFGPVGVLAPPERRSMREQVAGTGAFLRREGPRALHAAQARALHEAARARIPGYARMAPPAAAQAIARATALQAAALERALHPDVRATTALPGALELLDQARRRLSSFPSTASPRR